MKRDWHKLLSGLPRGLSFSEAAKRLGTPYQITRIAIQKFGYPAIDGRAFAQLKAQRLFVDHVDWAMPNAAIAKKFGVTRELVRLRRKQAGLPAFTRLHYRKLSVNNKPTQHKHHESKTASNRTTSRQRPARARQGR